MKSPEIQTNFVIVKPSEQVSSPPFIDIGRAKNSAVVASRFIQAFVEGQKNEKTPRDETETDSDISTQSTEAQFQSPALTLAVALVLYNHPESPQTLVRSGQVHTQLSSLIRAEAQAAKPDSPLPTIGWEVEAPLFPYFLQTRDKNMYTKLYKFSDSIGIPHNGINDVNATDPAYWEYSSPPSYSAEVSARILSELIKGRFIPSLRTSHDPEMVQDYLMKCLISLHINIGIPSINPHDRNAFTQMREDGKYLAALMALGFTSQLRLENKKSSLLSSIKDAEFTEKSGTQRLEMKGLEMLRKSSFKQFEYAQLLSAALFASYTQSHETLGEVWRSLREETVPILPTEDVVFSQDTDDISKKNVLKRMEDSDAQEHTREILTRHVNWTKHLLRQ